MSSPRVSTVLPVTLTAPENVNNHRACQARESSEVVTTYTHTLPIKPLFLLYFTTTTAIAPLLFLSTHIPIWPFPLGKLSFLRSATGHRIIEMRLHAETVFLTATFLLLVISRDQVCAQQQKLPETTVSCTMCSSCDNPCQPIPYPSPPPPTPSPPPPHSTKCPPPPSSTTPYYSPPPPSTYIYYSPPPPSGGSSGMYYYPPPYGGGGGGEHYKTPPPPNPIVQYFPFYYHSPPPPGSGSGIRPLSASGLILLLHVFRWI